MGNPFDQITGWFDSLMGGIASLYRTVTGMIDPVWSRMAPGDALPDVVLAIALVLGSVPVLVPFLWKVTRHGITIVHEMGHATTAGLMGRRIAGIKLHTDTSGVALTAGKSHGIGMLATLLGGYTAASIWGLLIVIASVRGWSGLALTMTCLLLVGALTLVRNLWGLLTVAVTLVLSGALWWFQVGEVAALVTAIAGGFLLAGGVRTAHELAETHSRERCTTCDAGQAASISLPGVGFWITYFHVFAYGCVAASAGVIMMRVIP